MSVFSLFHIFPVCLATNMGSQCWQFSAVTGVSQRAQVPEFQLVLARKSWKLQMRVSCEKPWLRAFEPQILLLLSSLFLCPVVFDYGFPATKAILNIRNLKRYWKAAKENKRHPCSIMHVWTKIMNILVRFLLVFFSTHIYVHVACT